MDSYLRTTIAVLFWAIFLLNMGCEPNGEGLDGNQDEPIVREEDEEQEEEEFVPFPVANEAYDGSVEKRMVGEKRCAVIVGDDTLGIGPKDARDFESALKRFPEWRSPNGLYKTIFSNATLQGVQDAIKALYGKGCVQLVFFYSGHGSNRQGDKDPRDESQDRTIVNKDEYLSLRNRQSVRDRDIDDTRRVYDDQLGILLRDWQIANRSTRPVTGSGGRQFVYVYPELLVILHACRSGGFVGGGSDLDTRLRERFEILMGSGETELCRARRPIGGLVMPAAF